MTLSILALDLSLVATGWCRDGESGVIKTSLRGAERLHFIREGVVRLVYRYPQVLEGKADLCVVEGYSYGSQGRSVFDIGELGGVVKHFLWSREIPVALVPPSTLKKYATGKGNSPKDAMIAAAIRRFGFGGSDNNEADAWLLWCLAMHAYGHPVASVPKAQEEAVCAVTWPDLGVLVS